MDKEFYNRLYEYIDDSLRDYCMTNNILNEREINIEDVFEDIEFKIDYKIYDDSEPFQRYQRVEYRYIYATSIELWREDVELIDAEKEFDLNKMTLKIEITHGDYFESGLDFLN